jgi:hypothetical protein
MSGYIYASERFPCPLCRAKKDCRVRSETNAVYCHTHRDAYGAPSDYLWRGLSNNGVWGIWVHETDLGRGYDPDRPRHTPAPQKLPPTTTTGPSRFEKVHRDIQPAALRHGRGPGRSPGPARSRSPGTGPTGRTTNPNGIEQPWAWTLPEWGYDSRGNFLEVAIHLRYGDGTKWQSRQPGGRRRQAGRSTSPRSGTRAGPAPRCSSPRGRATRWLSGQWASPRSAGRTTWAVPESLPDGSPINSLWTAARSWYWPRTTSSR